MYGLLLATLAGLCTGIGSAIALALKQLKGWQLALILGFSAGVMTYVSFAELLTQAVKQAGLLQANILFFVGFAFIAVLDLVIPHQYKAEELDDHHPLLGGQHSALMRIGIFTSIGIAIHNIPEGLVVFAGASSGDVSLGVLVATAIALHNIPEGIAVSVPVKEATGNARMAFLLSFAAGLAEPLGALLGYLILSPFLTTSFVAGLLTFAAGIMIYISLDELVPTAHRYGAAHWAILGVGLGMAVMAGSVLLIS